MFVYLLCASFVVALLVSAVLSRIFRNPVAGILRRIIAEDIYRVWSQYMQFAIYVVGISGGVRVWDLEKYLNPRDANNPALVLNGDRWVLEIYRTFIGTIQSVAWLLLVFFIFTMLAYVIVKGMELKHQPQA
jgi:hypothetical protein